MNMKPVICALKRVDKEEVMFENASADEFRGRNT
jgi:hypothetical protein